MAGPVARRALAALAQLLPVESQAAYRTLRFLYHLIPVSLERKMPWAQHLLTDVPQLQQVAYRVARTQGLPASFNAYSSRSELEGPLLPPARRILVVEHRLPTPDRNSSSVRLYEMLRLMRELDWEVTFVSDTRKTDYRGFLSDTENELLKYEQPLSALGICCLYGMDTLMELLKSEGGRYRFALLSYPEIMHQYAPLVRAFMVHARLIYDTVDLHSVRFAREAAIMNNNAGLLEKSQYYSRIEFAGVEYADTVISISDSERKEILERVPTAHVEIIPNVHEIVQGTAGPEAREGLLFIGHYLHTPNEDAVLHFINQILPLIQRQLPDIRFYVLGSSITADLKKFDSERIHMVGYVEDPAPWFAKARVFVAPLRYGAGIKGKIGQSLALGLPVVTTSIGAEGMQLEHGKNVLIADDSASFADAVVKLHREAALWRTIAENGKAHIATHFSHATARQALAHVLHDDLASGPRISDP